MEKYLVKKAPFQIPEDGKKAIVNWAPWIALVFGVLSIISALSLWGLARQADEYTNEISRLYGVDPAAREVGFMVYLTILVVAVQGTILLLAFSGLQDRRKSKGWNLLLLGVLLGFAYSLSTLFIDSYYRGSANIIFSFLGVIVGLYVLAQIRSYYNGAPPRSNK